MKSQGQPGSQLQLLKYTPVIRQSAMMMTFHEKTLRGQV
jgi:hypothetical protein